jgi:hypothetical protein
MVKTRCSDPAMEKLDLVSIVKKVSINWDAATGGPPFKERCALWWKFLEDLSADSVNDAVDQIIVLDQQRLPRVGQVRRLAIDLALGDDIPTAPQAWAQFRAAIDAAESGTSFDKPHDLVGETMRSFPKNGAGLRTNSDRELFLKAYETIVLKAERNRYLSG